MMSISGVSAFTPTTQSSLKFSDQEKPAGGGFSSMLNQYMDDMKATHHESVSKSTALITGKADSASMSEAMLAMQKSSVSLELLMASRNKMMDAYRQVMRMPV